MARNVRSLIWQIPVTVLVSIVASVIVVWVISGVIGMPANDSLVAAMSAILAAVAIAIEVGQTESESSVSQS